MWRVLPTHCVSRTERTARPVLSYYIMHYYLLIALLSVLTSLEPILDKPVSSPRTIERVERTRCALTAYMRAKGREKERKYQLKRALTSCVVIAQHRCTGSLYRNKKFNDTFWKAAAHFTIFEPRVASINSKSAATATVRVDSLKLWEV